MTLRFTVAAATLLMSSVGFAAVTLTVPEEIKIVAVNDQELSGGLFRSAEKYTLNAGENVISVRYTEFFQHPDNSHDILKSGVASIRTPVLADGQQYRLALIDAPKDFDKAQKYKDQPIFGLYNKANQLLVQQQGAKQVQKAIFSNAIFGNNLDLTKKTTAPANQPAPVYTQNTSAVVNASDQQLIQLWQKATKVERQEFMSWLAEQSN